MKSLFDTTSLRGCSLKNRFFRSATWMAMADDSGLVSDDLIAVYRAYAHHQVAGIITGFTHVSRYDKWLPGAVRFTEDKDVPHHARLTEAVHAEDSRIFLQAAILSPHGADGEEKSVDDLSLADIKTLISAYQQAAVRAEQAGYDGLQIHAAHFFGLSKCLSPACNHRKDAYGGSAKGRAKLLLDIHAAIRESVQDTFLILIKINCSDFVPGGLSQDDFLTACQMLSQAGIDAIEVSGNGTSRPHIRAGVNEGYFQDAARLLKMHLPQTPIILVGGLRSPAYIESLLSQNVMDYIALSRPLICEPDLVARWQAGDKRPARCVSCNGCYESYHHQCSMNRGREENAACSH